MLIIKAEANLAENHQQAQSSIPLIRAHKRRAPRKDGSKLIVGTRCFQLAPETRKGRGTMR